MLPLARLLRDNPRFDLQVVAMNMHLSPEFGLTVKEIEAEFPVAAKIEMLLSSSSASAVSKTVGVGILGLADALDRLAGDLVIILGDRYELLTVITVCICQRIPILHLCGGEITFGALDEQVRHLVTKASHLHCPANEVFAKRIRQMGEEEWRICVTGSPALDNLASLEPLSRAQLEEDLGIEISERTALVTYHPATLDPLPVKSQIGSLIEALRRTDLYFVITYPNSDPGSDLIIPELHRFAEQVAPRRTRLLKNLGRHRFYSLLSQIKMMIGNSSSGIVEAPSFGVYAVNIGSRQTGRVFGENVISTDSSAESILRAIEQAIVAPRKTMSNPYGDGKASPRIINFILEIWDRYKKEQILLKKFMDR